MYSEREIDIFRKAAAIPLRLIYDSIPKEHLEFFLPYVIIPTGKSDPPHICYLLSPEELNIPRETIWPDKYYKDNKDFMEQAITNGRNYKLHANSEPAAIYQEIAKFNSKEKKEPINIEIYTDPYGRIRSKDSVLEYRGVDHLYPMAIYCRQKKGECFLLASADYSRSPYLDFMAIRWKDSLKSIASVQFWDLFIDITGIDVKTWCDLKKSARNTLRANIHGFAAHHMYGGVEKYNEEIASDKKVIAALLVEPKWKSFINSYDYKKNISGAVTDWQRPPIRAILETCENEPPHSKDLSDTIYRFKESFDPDSKKLFILDNIPKQYNYFWFNCSALLCGIKNFIENNKKPKVKFILSFNILDKDSLKGLLVQIYQIDDTSSPINIEEPYIYNQYFPNSRSRPNEIGGLSASMQYFYYSGVKLLLYRGFDPSSAKYLFSIIKLLSENSAEITGSSLIGNNIFDATLGLFIPADSNVSYRYRKGLSRWLVAEKVITIKEIGYFKEKLCAKE